MPDTSVLAKEIDQALRLYIDRPYDCLTRNEKWHDGKCLSVNPDPDQFIDAVRDALAKERGLRV